VTGASMISWSRREEVLCEWRPKEWVVTSEHETSPPPLTGPGTVGWVQGENYKIEKRNKLGK